MVKKDIDNKAKQYLKKYIMIIEGYLDKKISVNEFENEFLQLHRNDSNLYSEEIGTIISKLFSDIDSYCGDEEIANYDVTDPFHDIDELELRNRVWDAFNELKKVDFLWR